jgi:MFS family permease
LVSIGLPYFLLSSNSSLMQRWYSHNTNSSPYFLFSISNAGSLLGLISYPFVIEWLLPTSGQMLFWSVSFCLLTILIILITVKIVFNKKNIQTEQTEKLGKNIPLKKALLIIMLGFVPSSLFLSSTLYMTSEIGSFPLLWIIPLTLYLLSFILVFSAKGDWWTKNAQKLTLIAVMVALYSGVTGFPSIIITALVAFFIIATSCHGRVAQEKPEAEYITAYYFWLSVGGALGGLFNTIAPYIFNDVLEYYIVMFFALLAIPSKHSFKKLPLKKIIPTFAILAAALFYLFQVNVQDAKNKADSEKFLFKDRNFFGVSLVLENTKDKKRYYKQGSTTHGQQSTQEAEKLSPSAYYVPIYRLINKFESDFFTKPFGVLGLGVGTVSCYGKEGQQFDFFEVLSMIRIY